MTTDAARRFRIRLFGRYRDLAEGHPEIAGDAIELSLPDGATVADLVAALHARKPGRLPERPAVAVNRRLAGDTAKIEASDEIALVPPVAGG